MILGVTAHICARFVCAYCFCLQMLAHSHSWPGQDNGKASQLVTMRVSGLYENLLRESRITTSVSFLNLLDMNFLRINFMIMELSCCFLLL